MVFDYEHNLPLEEARSRLEALGEYLSNSHGIEVKWLRDGDDKDKVHFRGKYLVVKIEGEMRLEPNVVHVEGKDPGMLWRKKATQYLHGKLATYLDPQTPLEQLPRRK